MGQKEEEEMKEEIGTADSDRRNERIRLIAFSTGLSQRLVYRCEEESSNGLSLSSSLPSCALPEGARDGFLPFNL